MFYSNLYFCPGLLGATPLSLWLVVSQGPGSRVLEPSGPTLCCRRWGLWEFTQSPASAVCAQLSFPRSPITFLAGGSRPPPPTAHTHTMRTAEFRRLCRLHRRWPQGVCAQPAPGGGGGPQTLCSYHSASRLKVWCSPLVHVQSPELAVLTSVPFCTCSGEDVLTSVPY